MAIYTNNFCKVFTKVLAETGVTCYMISQYSGLDEGYLSRLKSRVKVNQLIMSRTEKLQSDYIYIDFTNEKDIQLHAQPILLY